MRRKIKSRVLNAACIKTIHLSFIFMFYAFSSLSSYAQEQLNVSGNVVDSSGEAIIGVNVIIKGTTTGTITDVNGNYNLSDVSSEGILSFSFIGMKSKEVLINRQKIINVILEPDNTTLDEVVAVGYGTMKKSDLTGSIVSISSEKLEKETPTSVQDLLRSGAPGLSVSLTNTAEGGGDLLVRGTRSLAAETSPLIVLDGIIFQGTLNEINPLDIEKIEVLKDASSAAVYGAKSANGVVIITTKKGVSSKPTIRARGNVGIVTMGSNREVYDAKGYLQYRTDLFKSTNSFENSWAYDNPTNNLLSTNGITIEDWRAYDGTSSNNDEDTWLQRIGLYDKERENYFSGKTYDWYDASFRTGLRQDYNISMSGKGNKLNYYWSLGYLNSEGVVVGDNYKAYRSNLKLDANVTDFIDVGINLNYDNRSLPKISSSGSGINGATDWKTQVLFNSPFAVPYDDDGNLVAHPMGDGSLNEGYNQAYENKYYDANGGYNILNTTMYAKIKLPFGITYQTNFSPRFIWYKYRDWSSSEHVDDTNNGYVYRESYESYNWQIDNMIKWNHTFNDIHRVDITLLQNAENNQSWKEYMTCTDFTPSDALGWHYVGSAGNVTVESEDRHSTGDALMARLFYSYNNKYMITASLRRDGFSAFGSSNKRATFPAIALGWSFINEDFLDWGPLSTGKLRLSWGKNGNRDIGIYQAMSNLTTGTGDYAYVNYDGSITEVSQLYVSRMANDDLKWETSSSYNIGLDLGIVNNRYTASIDAYYMPTTDLLMDRSLPGFTGYNSITTNLGEVVNKGFELSINSTNIQRSNFTWSTTFGLSYNKNEIKHLYNTYEYTYDENGNISSKTEVNDKSNGWFIGRPISQIWDYECIGIWQEGQEEEAAVYGQKPGDAICRDVDGDGNIDTDDKQFLGQTVPKVRWSFRNNFTILKDFDVSVNIYSYMGHKATTTEFLHYSGYTTDRTNAYIEKYWTPDNPSNRYARLNSTLPNNVYPKLIMDKTFIRLDNISLSYRVPEKICQKVKVNNINIYANVKNVAVWCKEWEYWDPEITGPVPRTYTIGLNLTL